MSESTLPQTVEELVAYINKALGNQADGFNKALGELQRKNEELASIHEDLEVRLRLQNEKIQALENLNPNSFSSVKPPSVKLSKPSEFTGDKDSIDAKTWLTQVILYCTQWPDMSDRQRIAVMLSFMKGTAGKWAQRYIEDLPTGNLTMETFDRDFEAMWTQEDVEGKAI
jgi:hypothetical protein